MEQKRASIARPEPVEGWAFRLEDSPSGHSFQVLARITALWAFHFCP